MRSTHDGVWLSTAEVESIGKRLAEVGRVTHCRDAGELATFFVVAASEIASLLAAQAEPVTLTTYEYARLHRIPLRTVQDMCSGQRIPGGIATKDELGRWQIRMIGTEGFSMVR